jgi:hypothetical protein
MVNDLLPERAKPAEIAGCFVPLGADDQRPGYGRNCDSIEIAAFFGLARFLQC